MEIKINDFIPRHTFECGQCFRWEEQPDESYIGVANSQVIRISQSSDGFLLEGCSKKDFEDFWRHYLDLDRDYAHIKASVNVNDTMNKAIKFGNGIRILRQDFFETLISFIISQRSSIPKIKSCVDKLCRLAGKEILFEGKSYYSFPDAAAVAALSEDELRALGVGYRAPYILRAAQEVASGNISGEELRQLSTASARERLLKLYGVGDKVCDCVLLFSLGKYDLFPSDVWIKRVMAEQFNTDNAKASGESLFENYSGFAQQYLFYWRKYNNA